MCASPSTFRTRLTLGSTLVDGRPSTRRTEGECPPVPVMLLVAAALVAVLGTFTHSADP